MKLLIERTYEVKLNTAFGPFNAISYKQLTDDTEHLALVKGCGILMMMYLSEYTHQV